MHTEWCGDAVPGSWWARLARIGQEAHFPGDTTRRWVMCGCAVVVSLGYVASFSRSKELESVRRRLHGGNDRLRGRMHDDVLASCRASA